MNVEEEIQTITLEEQLMTPKTEVTEYQPPAQQQIAQPVQQMSAQPVDVPQTQASTCYAQSVSSTSCYSRLLNGRGHHLGSRLISLALFAFL